MTASRTNRTPKRRSQPDWAPKFLAALARNANIKGACKAAKVGRSTVYERRDSDEAFAEAMAHALEDACDDLELEARRRAKRGNATLMIFLLKAHNPIKFRDSLYLEHAGGVRVALTEELVDADDPKDNSAVPGAATVPPQ